MQVTKRPTLIVDCRLPIDVIANLRLPIANLNMIKGAMLTKAGLCKNRTLGVYSKSEIGNKLKVAYPM